MKWLRAEHEGNRDATFRIWVQVHFYAIVSSCEMIKRTCFPILSEHSPFVAFPVPEERSHFNDNRVQRRFFSSSSTSSSPPLHKYVHSEACLGCWRTHTHTAHAYGKCKAKCEINQRDNLWLRFVWMCCAERLCHFSNSLYLFAL